MSRLPAIDWMRGFVMILMAWDHSGSLFDAGHLATDSVAWPPPEELPELKAVLARWVTHICAPTFLFLAGTSLALSVERRRGEGRSVEVGIFIRGLFIVFLELAVMSPIVHWGFAPDDVPFMFAVTVLYAIGMSFVLMSFLHHLPSIVLSAVGVGILVFGELVTVAIVGAPSWGTPWYWALTLSMGYYAGPPQAFFMYPVVPWLAMMMLGWVLGRRLARDREWNPIPALVTCGLLALVVFAVVRGANGYGNYELFRPDDSLAAWLRVAKYPPSLAFSAMELGLLGLFLASFFAFQRSRPDAAPHLWNPLHVFGQTALFFYVLHFPLLISFSKLGLIERGGLAETFVGTVAALAVLYPVCVLYGRYKRAHRNWFTSLV